MHIQKELCPQEILDLTEMTPEEYLHSKVNIGSSDITTSREIEKKYNKQHRKIWNIIENEVRLKFGHKKIGEAWTSETILYFIIEKLFPNQTIFRHYRPSFLDGLELDIFIKELNVGIEYQGIQHYKAVKHWGGQESLQKLKERDKKKKKICEKLGVKLVYFKYDEELSDNFVKVRITCTTQEAESFRPII